MIVETGLDRWVADDFAALRGLTVGLIANQTSVDARLRHSVDLLASASGVRLKALFGPEHGVRGEAQYMEPVDQLHDERTGLPVFSLYGRDLDSLSPKPEWLRGLDALVFDIQDVGSRYYTYASTMALSIKAAAQAKIRFFVLDRPNPIGGVLVEGNLVTEKFRSFVGLFALPNRHGMTVGELAMYLNQVESFGCDLSVVSCRGWSRSDDWSKTGLAFIPPSPNMPTPDTALVYPGMCLLEGTNLSEGRGTCRPFEQFGAPWIDSRTLIGNLERERLPGVAFRPVSFTPTFDKFTGKSCSGAMLHVTDRHAFRPLLTGIAIVRAAYELGGRNFAWRSDAYEFVNDIPAFDLLCGTDQVRIGIEEGRSLSQLTEGFEAQLRPYLEQKRKFHRYE